MFSAQAISQAEDKANIYTYNNALKNQLVKFRKDHPNCAKLITSYIIFVFLLFIIQN